MATTNNNNNTTVGEPLERDVMLGRGGKSYHHPGNEWFRRLIRANQPLYNASPKHTKLLVSKAIVHAVGKEGGRYLEMNKDTGMWFEVSFERALAKTTQALRERPKSRSSITSVSSSSSSGNAQQARLISTMSSKPQQQSTNAPICTDESCSEEFSSSELSLSERSCPPPPPPPHPSLSLPTSSRSPKTNQHDQEEDSVAPTKDEEEDEDEEDEEEEMTPHRHPGANLKRLLGHLQPQVK